jgi:hypothetical protein
MTERVNAQGQVLMTKELLLHLGSCGLSLDRPNQKNYDPEKDDGSADGHYYTIANMWDKPEMECLAFCMENKLFKDVAWYIKQRETEKFVRYTGKVFTMGKYQVFNPLTGLHEFCETEELAKIAIAEISKKILATQPISVCREMSNEHGHTTWAAEQIVDPISVTANI